MVFVSCDRPPPPSYDSVPNRLLLQGLQALKSDEPGAAIANLERLSDLRPEYALPHVILQQEYEDQAIADATQALSTAEGDLEGAIDAIETVMVEQGISPRLDRERIRLQALERLRQYRDAGPYHSSDDWTTALRALPEADDLLDDAPLFREWLRSERRAMSELTARERNRRVDGIILDVNQAILTAQWQELTAHIDRLAAEVPGHGIVLASRGKATIADFGKPTLENEISLFLLFQRANQESRAAIADIVVPRPARSATGMRLRVMAAFQQRYLLSAMIGLDELVSKHADANVSDLRRRFDASVPDRERAPWPSMRGVLTPIYYLQQYP